MMAITKVVWVLVADFMTKLGSVGSPAPGATFRFQSTFSSPESVGGIHLDDAMCQASSIVPATGVDSLGHMAVASVAAILPTSW